MPMYHQCAMKGHLQFPFPPHILDLLVQVQFGHYAELWCRDFLTSKTHLATSWIELHTFILSFSPDDLDINNLTSVILSSSQPKCFPETFAFCNSKFTRHLRVNMREWESKGERSLEGLEKKVVINTTISTGSQDRSYLIKCSNLPLWPSSECLDQKKKRNRQ